MIPTSTGAADTLGDILPVLGERITRQVIQVPTVLVSCGALIVETDTKTTSQTVHDAFTEAVTNALCGMLNIEKGKLVSVDMAYNQNGRLRG